MPPVIKEYFTQSRGSGVSAKRGLIDLCFIYLAPISFLLAVCYPGLVYKESYCIVEY